MRMTSAINATWLFHRDKCAGAERVEFDDRAWAAVTLPHCWNAHDVPDDAPGYYRGVGVYRARFHHAAAPGTAAGNAPADQRKHFLHFDGVNQSAWVYLNGQPLGEHHGGYTAFTFDITDHLRDGTNLLTVQVSNAHDENVAPVAGDLCHFGGIYRAVRWITVDPVHFDPPADASPSVRVDTPHVSADSATVRVRGIVRNDSSAPVAVELHADIFDPAGSRVSSLRQPLAIPPRQRGDFELLTEPITHPRLWSPDEPNLYHVEMRLVDAANGRALDHVREPLGFRWFHVDADEGFFLNGRRLFLRGIGAHQDYPLLGFAVPEDRLIADAAEAKAAGANALRSHYPLTPAVYDYCDRAGLIVWLKIPIMFRIAHTAAFWRNAQQMMRETIGQNFNHPSVILLGSICEPLGDLDWFWPRPHDADLRRHELTEIHRFAREMEDLTRELDPSRLTANDYHTNPSPELHHEAGLLDINAVNGWNIYQGWYHRDLEQTEAMLEQTRAYAPSRPYLLAEYGAGSDTRIHTYEPTIFDFSGEYESRLHQHYLTVVPDKRWVAGMFLWTLLDFQVESRGDVMPHINNKGLLTGRRERKDVFHLYQAHWSDQPVAHIAAHHWRRRLFVADPGQAVTFPVEVYSNRDEVELIVDGRTAGRVTVRQRVARFDLTLTEGPHHIQVVGRAAARDGTDAFDAVDLDVRFIPADLSRHGLRGQSLQINVGQSRTHFHDTLTDQTWLPDHDWTPGGFGHVGGQYWTHWPATPAWHGIRQGVGDTIRGTDLVPIYQTFLIGLDAYRLDVPDGEYRVRLHLAEPFTHAQRVADPSLYGAANDGRRVFDVAANGQRRHADVDIQATVGVHRAMILEMDVYAADGRGVSVEFTPKQGRPLLSGVSIRPRG